MKNNHETELMTDDKTNEAHDLRLTVFDRTTFGAETPAWERGTSEQVADCRVFRVRRDLNRHAFDNREGDFYVLEMPDWINVIPLTTNDEVVMIEQYRHGINQVTLEIPGGTIDAGESPHGAASRELLEETGCVAREWIDLGKTHPNPAIQDNWVHTALARDVRFTQRAPVIDTSEHTTVRLVPLASVPDLIAGGIITHSLVIVGFYLLNLYRNLGVKHDNKDFHGDFAQGR